MALIYREHGGGWIGGWQASWPFSTLEIHDDKIVLRVWPLKAEIPLSEIESVRRLFFIPFIADGIKIKHGGHTPYAPSLLIFWSLFNAKKILKLFEERGIKVGK